MGSGGLWDGDVGWKAVAKTARLTATNCRAKGLRVGGSVWDEGEGKFTFVGKLVRLAVLAVLGVHAATAVVRSLYDIKDNPKCAAGMLSAALVVNHYKRTWPEFKERYTRTWQHSAYTGVGDYRNPHKNMNATFRWWNSQGNQCKGRTSAARFAKRMHEAVDAGAPAMLTARNGTEVCIEAECRRYLSSIVAIMHEEEPRDVEEWVLFHRSAGFDHIYLYDQGNQTASGLLLQRYIDAGFVTLLPTAMEQSEAYRDALRFANTTFWMARLDVDEFIVPMGADNVAPLLTALYRRGPLQLLMPRFDFGDSGHSERPPGWNIEVFTRSAALPFVFKPMITAPALSRLAPEDVDNNPHKFVDQKKVPSCEGIVRLFVFILCPKDRRIYYVGFN